MEQRTEEWLNKRHGHVGCSRIGAILATGKAGTPSATRKNYMAELICERLTGKRTEHYTSKEMEWGIENEPLARASYEAKTGSMVEEHGGKECESIPDWWGSPDGLVGIDGGIEIKCPNTATHIETLLTGKVAQEYVYQMAGYVKIYDRKWWDFISYDPRLPERLSMFVKRFTRDELPIDQVDTGVLQFIKELKELEEKLEAIT
jgi:hypothetical protein